MTVWRQSGLVWFGALIAAGMALLTQILLARHFDTALFGAISYAYAIAILISTFAFQGIGEVAIRHQGRLDPRHCLRSAAGLFAVATLGALALFDGWTDIGANMLLALHHHVMHELMT